jgi:ribosome-associated protein
MSNRAPIDDVAIGGEVIRLGQILKFTGLLDSGGDVKEAIIDGLVAANGEDGRRVRVCA